MATYAVLSDNVVVNIIVSDDKDAIESALQCSLIEYTLENPVSVGWVYDYETSTFTPPLVEATSTEQ